jgi:hypothetical protein
MSLFALRAAIHFRVGLDPYSSQLLSPGAPFLISAVSSFLASCCSLLEKIGLGTLKFVTVLLSKLAA